MKKKYEMLMEDGVTFEYENEMHTLYRIRALRNFGNISKGTTGGYIESEKNLSHKGNCWVSGNAIVYGDASVSDNASVSRYARVYGNAMVKDNARVYGNARVYDCAVVLDNASVFGDARVRGNAFVRGDAHVYAIAEVRGTAEVYGVAKIGGDAIVSDRKDHIVFKNWWSSGRYFTWTRSNNMWQVGCFYGTGEELIKKAYRDSDISGREYERIVKYVEEILRDERE